MPAAARRASTTASSRPARCRRIWRQLGRQVVVAPGGVGLALEGAKLAPHLAEQVLQPQQAAFGGFEAALGSLLALAVLEDPRRLLDDEAAVLGPGVQHRVQLSLGDDDVLLAADTGVGEQLLHVEQAARRPVDGVFAVTGTEQGPGDRDLGEPDRQQARLVVDGQRHLGPPERRSFRRPREDDVLHLGGPHCAGALGAEHPRHGVDDVGFAAAVGPDHDGHPGLEVQGGRVGEGLESLQGERLQEHGGGQPSGRDPPVVRPWSPGTAARCPACQGWQRGQRNVERPPVLILTMG